MNQDQDIIMKYQENPNKKYFMKQALKEAKKAYDINEVPVGAVVVYQGKIIARGHNKRESQQAFHAHAEFIAMQKAAKKLGTWRLEDCDVYVTMEPCPMCAGAMLQARISSVFYGVTDQKGGAIESVVELFNFPFNHQINIEKGVLAEESQALIKRFFIKLRKK